MLKGRIHASKVRSQKQALLPSTQSRRAITKAPSSGKPWWKDSNTMATRVCQLHGRRHTRLSIWAPDPMLQPSGGEHALAPQTGPRAAGRGRVHRDGDGIPATRFRSLHVALVPGRYHRERSFALAFLDRSGHLSRSSALQVAYEKHSRATRAKSAHQCAYLYRS